MRCVDFANVVPSNLFVDKYDIVNVCYNALAMFIHHNTIHLEVCVYHLQPPLQLKKTLPSAYRRFEGV